MKKILFAASIILTLLSGLVYWGSSFATTMVHDQLAAQKISFPAKDQLQKDNPALVAYAGQPVDNGDKAKAYSEYIAGHLKNTANGKTYSEVSSEYQKDRSNQTLASQRQTLFMGETLRGLLLNAWGWGLIGTIAGYAAAAIFAAAVLLFAVAVFYRPLQAKKK